MTSSSSLIQGFKDEYTIQDLGTLKHYLGITVEGLDDSVIVHQRSYAISIIKKFARLISKRSGDGQSPQKKVKTPFLSGCRLSKMDKASETPAQSRLAARFPYQQVIGALMYLGVNTRPDLAHSLIVLSRFNKDPTYKACKAAWRCKLSHDLPKLLLFLHHWQQLQQKQKFQREQEQKIYLRLLPRRRCRHRALED
jgi:hypothetical protein